MYTKKFTLMFILISLLTITIMFSSVCFASSHWASNTLNSFKDNEFVIDEVTEENLDGSILKHSINSILNRFYGKDISAFSSNELQDQISREEACALFCKVLSLKIDTSSTPNFVDVDDISDWALSYVYVAQLENLVVGYPNGEFKPKAFLSNAEFLTILSRSQGLGGRDEPEILDLIDEEITDIEIGIIEYSSGEIKAIPLSGDTIELKKNDKITISVAIPDENQSLKYKVSNKNLISFDDETNTIEALKKGSTQITFRTSDNKFKKVINIIIK